jgi:radical SAM protein with 4Fe4S-binding SPASM domain
MEQYRTRIIGRARAERRPLSCLFELTPTCNLRCHFCYVALDPYKGPYLSTEQACRVLDIAERAGVLWLTLTGGEILSRRDFPAIYAHAKRSGFLVTLFTNGTMMNERIATMLRDDPPFSVEVSIYGADAAHYEATTGIPGSFARFERGVRLLIDAGVPLLLKCPISTFTHDHVTELVAYARERDVPFRFDPSLDARHDGGQQPTLYRISPKGVVQLHRTIRDLKLGEERGPLEECAIAPPPGEGTKDLYTCGAGRTAFFVDALGKASHCVIDREPSFPILEMEWDELWAAVGQWVTQPLPEEAPCSGCNLRAGCHNCPARSRLATGSPYLKDSYRCDVTHARYGLPPLEHPADGYRSAARRLAACAR